MQLPAPATLSLRPDSPPEELLDYQPPDGLEFAIVCQGCWSACGVKKAQSPDTEGGP